jgi:hypothetical protein
VKVLAELLKANITVQGLDVNSNGLNADAGKLFLPIVDKPHFEMFSGIPIKQIRENTVTKLDLKGSKGKQLEACGGIVLAHVLTGNTSVQGLDVSLNALKKEGLAAFKEVLLTTSSLTDINLSANAIIGSGGQPIIDQVVAETSFKLIEDEPGVQACLILRKEIQAV